MVENNKRLIHKAVITWNEEKKAFLCSVGNKTIEIVASQESKRHEGMLTPEELFVDSIEGFIKAAFMDSAKRNNLEVLSYKSEGQGIVKKVEDKIMFTKIKIRPKIIVAVDSQVEKAKELIDIAGKNCFISNFITAKINIEPEIKIGMYYDEF